MTKSDQAQLGAAPDEVKERERPIRICRFWLLNAPRI
jgi:hypothetical protein